MGVYTASPPLWWWWWLCAAALLFKWAKFSNLCCNCFSMSWMDVNSVSASKPNACACYGSYCCSCIERGDFEQPIFFSPCPSSTIIALFFKSSLLKVTILFFNNCFVGEDAVGLLFLLLYLYVEILLSFPTLCKFLFKAKIVKFSYLGGFGVVGVG